MYTPLSSHRKAWSQQGICPEYPNLFGDNLTKSTISAAKGICNMCPVKELCKEWAIVNEVEGIFGGTTTTERKALRKGLSPEALEELLKRCPPEPKLLDYVKDPEKPKIVQKPKTVQTNPATYTETQAPSHVGQRARVSVKRTSPQEPQSLMASLDQLLLELPAFS